jgi:outer membrane protein TolC
MTHPKKQMQPQHNYSKLIAITLLLGLLHIYANAQVRNDQLVDTSKVMTIRERLVQLALQNPNYEIADRQISIANYQLRKAKNGLLSKANLSLNGNEYTFKLKSIPGGNNNLLFPLFNLGVSLPFDVFSSRKNEVAVAKENLSIAEAGRNQKFREVKAEILSKYEDYLMYKQKLEYESQIAQDAEAIFLQAEKDFSDGIIKQEDYNKAYKDRTEEKTKLAEIVRNFNVIKIEIEKMIGIPLDEVLQQTGK